MPFSGERRTDPQSYHGREEPRAQPAASRHGPRSSEPRRRHPLQRLVGSWPRCSLRFPSSFPCMRNHFVVEMSEVGAARRQRVEVMNSLDLPKTCPLFDSVHRGRQSCGPANRRVRSTRVARGPGCGSRVVSYLPVRHLVCPTISRSAAARKRQLQRAVMRHIAEALSHFVAVARPRSEPEDTSGQTLARLAAATNRSPSRRSSRWERERPAPSRRDS